MIHYEVFGERPRAEVVVLLHGLFSNGKRWLDNGFVAPLVESGFRVVCIDALGHGASEKPVDAALYSQSERARDVVRVLDAVGAKRAHIVGYSMGAWIALGVARAHADRAASLVIGGWDPVVGPMPVPFDVVLNAARARVPDIVKWVTREIEPALAACWSALGPMTEQELRREVAERDIPTLLWSGSDDHCHEGQKKVAAKFGFTFVGVKGDHASAMSLEVPRIVAAWEELFVTAESMGS